MVILFKLVQNKFTFMKNDKASINEVLNRQKKQKKQRNEQSALNVPDNEIRLFMN
jgi:hypothetical protein